MLLGVWRAIGCVQAILAVLAATVVISGRDPETIGDNLQVALPLVALGCSAGRGEAGEYALRFVAMMALAHGSKQALGDAPINRRPSGKSEGFPSAHTSAAVLGASALIRSCVARQPVAQAAVILAAAFVGGSRIEARKHTLWQVMAGAGLGYGCDRALRRDSAARRSLARGLRRVRRRAMRWTALAGAAQAGTALAGVLGRLAAWSAGGLRAKDAYRYAMQAVASLSGQDRLQAVEAWRDRQGDGTGEPSPGAVAGL